jgi:hypothetical protein
MPLNLPGPGPLMPQPYVNLTLAQAVAFLAGLRLYLQAVNRSSTY